MSSKTTSCSNFRTRITGAEAFLNSKLMRSADRSIIEALIMEAAGKIRDHHCPIIKSPLSLLQFLDHQSSARFQEEGALKKIW